MIEMFGNANIEMVVVFFWNSDFELVQLKLVLDFELIHSFVCSYQNYKF